MILFSILYAAIKAIDLSGLNQQGLKGEMFADTLHTLQLTCAQKIIDQDLKS
jgi:hypothetical protein